MHQKDTSLTVDALNVFKISSDFLVRFYPFQHVSQLRLADAQFNIPKSVNMHLGIDIFPFILKDEKFLGDGKQLSTINTTFGWIITGAI